jgi:flagellar basal-body rod modification protein FlgD
MPITNNVSPNTINPLNTGGEVKEEEAVGTAGENPDGILGKDDFLKLLLVELQHQDPTEPMDSEKILSQTSQLATLEASSNTNKSLEELAASLTSTNQFSTIAAIGKIGDVGSDEVFIAEDGNSAGFELYLEGNVEFGSVEITDTNGNIVDNIIFREGDTPGELKIVDAAGNDIETLLPIAPNVYEFNWNGITQNGAAAEAGSYHVNAKFVSPDGEQKTSKLGSYPIDSVRFDSGEALVKLGSNYVPFSSLKEVH